MNSKTNGRWGGFTSTAEFFQVVAKAGGFRGAGADPRLVPLAAAPGVLTRESSGAEGGFAAPPSVGEVVMQVVTGPTSLLARTTTIPTGAAGLQVILPISQEAPWTPGVAWAP